MSYVKKLESKIISCEVCSNDFAPKSWNAKNCPNCKHDVNNRVCICGCGKKTKKRYARGCSSRNKTYAQIYGEGKTKSGFKKGEENLAKLPSVRKRISEGVKKSYNEELLKVRSAQFTERLSKGPLSYKGRKLQNSIGEMFRSKMEVEFSEILLNAGIDYEYEVPIKMNGNKVKIVDFVSGSVLIEVTGYAYKAWQDDFDNKIRNLSESTNKQILIIGYGEKIELMRERSIFDNHVSQNIMWEKMENENRIIKTINLLNKINNYKTTENEQRNYHS